MTLDESENQDELIEEFDDYDEESARMNKRIERRFGLVAASAMVVALASLVTAGASIYLLVDSSQRSDERMTELMAIMQKTPSVQVPGTAGASNQQPAAGEPAPGQPGVPGQPAPAQGQPAQGQAQAPAQAGQAPAAPAQAGQAPAAAAPQQAGQAPAAPAEAAPQQAAPQQGAPAAPAAPAPAAGIPTPTPEILMQSAMAAAEPGVPGAQLAAHTVDGPAAAPALERIAEVRSKIAPPPGMENLGVEVRYEISNVVVNGDTATATLSVIWPGNWGRWDYPNSGFQYVDGEWKLQKSSVCNLAAAAWVDCY